jgi:hypothetical protein
MDDSAGCYPGSVIDIHVYNAGTDQDREYRRVGKRGGQKTALAFNAFGRCAGASLAATTAMIGRFPWHNSLSDRRRILT